MIRTSALQAISPFSLRELEAALQNKLGGRVRDLRLVVFEGFGLILGGIANNRFARQFAQHALMIETDIPILANEIEIREPHGP